MTNMAGWHPQTRLGVNNGRSQRDLPYENVETAGVSTYRNLLRRSEAAK
jgi:hypothetical protein